MFPTAPTQSTSWIRRHWALVFLAPGATSALSCGICIFPMQDWPPPILESIPCKCAWESGSCFGGTRSIPKTFSSEQIRLLRLKSGNIILIGYVYARRMCSNFSEGRDKSKVDAIVDSMKMPGVYLLDREMDFDHNRCVITLVGEREAIQEAAIRGVGKASELIDLNKHQGAHPRMGAADVVPFIPIEGVSIEDCVAMARQVGEQIWRRYQIPVYLYESAATTPERQGLENIRRGQFEGIRAEIATNPARRPDIGDPRVHPTAGATVVGARKFLIAYNVFLNTPDVEIAKKVAKAVRFSSGGMRFVKGAGF